MTARTSYDFTTDDALEGLVDAAPSVIATSSAWVSAVRRTYSVIGIAGISTSGRLLLWMMVTVTSGISGGPHTSPGRRSDPGGRSPRRIASAVEDSCPWRPRPPSVGWPWWWRWC